MTEVVEKTSHSGYVNGISGCRIPTPSRRQNGLIHVIIHHGAATIPLRNSIFPLSLSLPLTPCLSVYSAVFIFIRLTFYSNLLYDLCSVFANVTCCTTAAVSTRAYIPCSAFSCSASTKNMEIENVMEI
jgi:hypothetical protein